jgi:cobalt/nickel transport system permease protein
MHDLLDDLACRNGLLDVSPKVKLLIGLGSILICVSSPSAVAPLIIAVVLSAAVIFLAKIPPRFYLHLLAVPLSFAILSSIVVVLFHGTGSPVLSLPFFGWNITLQSDGLNLGLLLIARTFGGMASLFFVALTTPMIEIFAYLRTLWLPDSIIELSMLIYRYIFVLMEEALMIHSAQTMRLGGSGLLSRLRSISMLASVLFLRSLERGERLMVAMDSRCYSGKLVFGETRPASKSLVAAGIAYLLIMAAIAAMTRGVQPF